MRKPLLMLLTFWLAGCASQPPAVLSKIDAIQIPIVQNSSPSGEVTAMSSLYQQNKSILDNTTLNLKTDYLLNVKTTEIFDEHSQAHQVYISLSKLDQIRLVNNYYLKEKNAAGLQKVNHILRPLTEV